MQADQLIFVTLSLYLAAFMLFVSVRQKLGTVWVNTLSITANALGLGIAIYLCRSYQANANFRFEWVSLGEHTFYLSILLNKLSLIMLLLVQFIALLVQLFSTKYMQGEKRYTLYYAFLNFFIFSMLGLVLSGNLLFMFVFWELVGFSSYLLIGFWFEKSAANKASLKAFLMNRIGDAGFLLGIGLLFFQLGTLEFTQLQQAIQNPQGTLLTWTGLALFCGCIGKSAQFPLQTWLPDAMEGPTPVSALIHAATMVAAGIYLLASIHFVFTPTAGIIISFVGAFTAILAAYSALFQVDIKKVLAYSTVSQLGLMVMSMGAGAVHAALFHLFTHAFFKAGLFLIAGAVIHHLHHVQDMRKMGGLLKEKPWLAIAYVICGAALAGIPLTSGFLSKDALLISTWNWALAQPSAGVMIIPVMALAASVITAAYVVRQFYLVFLGGEGRLVIPKPDFLELVIVPLVIGSLWMVHASNPFSFENSYFAKWFEIPHQANHWLGYALLAASVVVAVWIYFRLKSGNTSSRPQTFAQKLGYYHYCLDEFYARKVAVFFVGTNTKHPEDELNEEDKYESGMAVLFNQLDEKLIDGTVKSIGDSQRNLSEVIYWLDRTLVDGFTLFLQKTTLFLGKTGAFLDGSFVDKIINGISFYATAIGLRLRSIQGGRIQSYMMVLLLFLLAIFLILNLL